MKSMVRIAALMMVLCLSLPAYAMSLDDAKSQLDSAKQSGLVGETPTGYLAVVRSGDHAADIVAAINEARRAEYARIAEKHGISVTKVEAVAGQKAMDKTPAGQFIQVDGKWVRK
ncbi:MAG: YdbL family protein [Marinobacter sp.]|nr:YdbL family protein [Marinobacter sp.]